MKKLGRIIAIAEMLVLPQLRVPATYILILSFPIIFLYMFWLLGGMQLAQHALFGGMVAIALNAGVISLPQSIVAYKISKLQDIFVASPVTAFEYIMGHGFSRLLFAVPGCVLGFVVLLLCRFMPVRAVPVTLVVLMITWATGCAVGFMLATYVQSPVQISAVANLIGLVMVLLPPVSYPIELIHSRWQWVAILLPSTSAAQLVKAVSGVTGLNGLAYQTAYWLVLVSYCGASFWLAINKSQWRER